MRWVLAVIAVSVWISPARALKPCHHGCHLEQGTPLLLPDRGEIWVRQCAKRKCTFERRDLEGATKQTLDTFDEYAFDDGLDGTRVVRLEHQQPWKNLAKPFVVPSDGRALTLGFAASGSKRTLVCQRDTARTAMTLPCEKPALVVRWAGIGADSKPEDPSGVAAVVATCGKTETTLVCK